MNYTYLFVAAVAFWAAIPAILAPHARALRLPVASFGVAIAAAGLIAYGLHDRLACLSETELLNKGACEHFHRRGYLRPGLFLFGIALCSTVTLWLARPAWLRRVAFLGVMSTHMAVGLVIFSSILLFDRWTGPTLVEAAEAQIARMGGPMDFRAVVSVGLGGIGVILTIGGMAAAIVLRFINRRAKSPASS